MSKPEYFDEFLNTLPPTEHQLRYLNSMMLPKLAQAMLAKAYQELKIKILKPKVT